MKILFCSQYFPPESNAPAVRVSEMAREWVASGHEVEVLTAFPHHPAGVIPAEYRRRVFQRERWNGVNVTRTWIYVAPNKGVIRRSIGYFSWMVSAIVLGSMRTARPHVVVATTPQFLCAVAGLVVSKIKRVPFVLEVRDLWPDSILAVGALKEGFVVRILRRIERFLYTSADRIVIVSPPFREHIAAIVPDTPIDLVPNGVDLQRFTPRAADADVYAAAGVRETQRILYTGTVGMAHGLETMIDAAAAMCDEDVAFVIVGDGARREELTAVARERGVANVYFLGQRPREEMPEWIAGAAAVVVHLRPSALFEGVLPSKLFEYMGCGKAVLMGVRGPASDIVERSACGWTFEPGNADDLVRVARVALAEGDACARRGLAGRAYVEIHYDRKSLAHRYLDEVLVPVRRRPR